MGKMSLSVYMKGDYEEFHALRRRKNKANSKPILVSPQIFRGLKNNLKKQSQFAPDLKSVKSFLKGDYENKSRPSSRKNKAKQSQFQGRTSPVRLCSG